MTNLERRLKKLEAAMMDTSGLVPYSQKWLTYWDQHFFKYMTGPEDRQPEVLFPVEAFRAVMKHMSNPNSLVGSIPGIYD